MTTYFDYHLLRACLLRGGTWVINTNGELITFYHNRCK